MMKLVKLFVFVSLFQVALAGTSCIGDDASLLQRLDVHVEHRLSSSAQIISDPIGLQNEGKACWGHCKPKAGNCSFCGSGQCCRKRDYDTGVKDCELAGNFNRCDNFRGTLALKNADKPCIGRCNKTPGNCTFCGTGQCCRKQDGQRCVPGCELAPNDLVGSRCGNFASTAGCSPSAPNPSPNPSPGGPAPTVPPDPTGLVNAGENCYSACSFRGGNCSFCGTGQCCTRIDWYRGVPGCELAENVTQGICGHFSRPHPEPAEFRLPLPSGEVPTPAPAPSNASSASWLMDLVAGPEDDAIPHYSGDGGQPWSPYEIVLVRDLVLREIQGASAGRDLTGGPKMLRLAFHDCLKQEGGLGGCDGCINWTDVGTEFGWRDGDGRVEEREMEDWERRPNNNGLQPVVEFLEYVYNFDFGMAQSCWMKPGTVRGGLIKGMNPWVQSVEECQQICKNTSACAYFVVPNLRFVDGRGPCRLYDNSGTLARMTRGRLIAGHGQCPNATANWSLRSRGKSRADLWAFASLLSVEEGIQRHNMACNGDRHPRGSRMCIQREGEQGCEITPSRPFIFQTGRKDCVSGLDKPYKAEYAEASPDEHFNGTMIVRFMEQNFGFSAKETVTIMGAHTVGRFHQRKSGHKYVWTTDWQAFNNQYYRNIAARDDWFFDDAECTKVGDAWNNPGHAVWIAKMNQVYRTGGPIQWIQKKVVCPNCAAKSYERGGRNPDRLALDRSCCLDNVPEGAFCRPDGNGPVNSTAFERDPDFSYGCEYSHFIFGRDETALGSDMGLMYKFNVDIRGFPFGCPGLDRTFYPASDMRFSDMTCGVDGQPRDPNGTRDAWMSKACDAGCPKQDYKYPGDDKALHEHVEHFADNQDAWIEEFLPTMEKMLSNGYADLVTSWPL